MASALAPLARRPYRTYLAGHAVASTGVWMQNIATDWLVLELTGSPAAVGITMACQFAPVLLLGLHAGQLADRFPKRNLLMVTQSLFLLLTASMAVLVLTGAARAELVWAIALVTGCVTAVDGPARQAFAGELVPSEHLRGAVSLNSAVFQTSRLLGPAIAATLISTVGTGWAFATTAACFTAPLVALLVMRPADLIGARPAGAPRPERAAGGRGGAGSVREALRHVRERPHVAVTIVLVGVVGTFGLNFPVVLTAMTTEVFTTGSLTGPQLYGAFNTALALGSTAGALLAGTRATTRLRLIVASCAAFGLLQAAAALVPSVPLFLAVLVVLGLVNLAFQAMANSSVQLWVDPAVRGRVMGLYLLAFVGGTPFGAPLVGWVTQTWGPRVGMAVCGLVPAAAAVVVAVLVLRRERSGARAAAGPAVRPALPAVPATLTTAVAAGSAVPVASIASRPWQPAAPASSSSGGTPPGWPRPRRRSSRPAPAAGASRWSPSSAAARPRTRPAGSRTGSAGR